MAPRNTYFRRGEWTVDDSMVGVAQKLDHITKENNRWKKNVMYRLRSPIKMVYRPDNGKLYAIPGILYWYKRRQHRTHLKKQETEKTYDPGWVFCWRTVRPTTKNRDNRPEISCVLAYLTRTTPSALVFLVGVLCYVRHTATCHWVYVQNQQFESAEKEQLLVRRSFFIFLFYPPADW